MGLRRLRHREPALANERDRVTDGQHVDRPERAVLADRMPDDDVRLDPACPERGVEREARRDERWLLHLGVDEVLHGPLEAQLLQVHARSVRGLVEDRHRLRDGLGDLPPHACLHRALPGKHERRLGHAAAPVVGWVHSINADPHVNPAPIPVRSTSFPGSSRPSSAASAIASGIEPDEVLPYLSTFTTVLSCGIPSFRAAWSMIRTLAWCGT